MKLIYPYLISLVAGTMVLVDSFIRWMSYELVGVCVILWAIGMLIVILQLLENSRKRVRNEN